MIMSSFTKESREEAILRRRCLIGRRTDHDECQGARVAGGDGKSARREDEAQGGLRGVGPRVPIDEASV
jgi:hypothetical protein